MDEWACRLCGSSERDERSRSVPHMGYAAESPGAYDTAVLPPEGVRRMHHGIELRHPTAQPSCPSDKLVLPLLAACL